MGTDGIMKHICQEDEDHYDGHVVTLTEMYKAARFQCHDHYILSCCK